jgi:acetyl esterase
MSCWPGRQAPVGRDKRPRFTREGIIAVAADIIDAIDPERMRDGFGLASFTVDEALLLLRGSGQPAALPAAPDGLRIEDRQIDGDEPIPIRIYTPLAAPPLGVLVNIHGGGWVGGSLDGDDPRCRILAEQAGVVVVSVGYRLAPEHRFPRGIDDCVAAIRWARDNSVALGAPAGMAAVLGASAGANITAAALLTLVGTEQQPLLQILLYPICDASMDFPSYSENATGYFLTRRDMVWYWQQYIGEADATDPLASILRSPDLARLPPSLVITAQYDPLRDEGERFVDCLDRAHVPTELIRYPGAIHGFVSLAPRSRLTGDALQTIAGRLKTAFAG